MKALIPLFFLVAGGLVAAPDAAPANESERLVQQAVMRDVVPQFAAASEAVAEHKPMDFASLDTAFRRFLAEWPDAEAGWQLLPTYLRLAGQAQPERTELEVLQTFLDSPNRHVRAFAKNRLHLEALKAQPLELQFTALDGRKVNMADLRGQVVLIDFWATWCVPCIAELPNVKRVYADYHDKGFEIIGVSLDRAGDRLKFIDLVAREGVTWPQRFEGQSWEDSLARRFAVAAIPATFLFNKSGCLVATDVRGQKLEAEVRRLLGE